VGFLLLQAGVTPEEDGRAVHVDCPPESASADCAAEEAVSPEVPPAAPAAPVAPAAVTAPAPAVTAPAPAVAAPAQTPSAFATVSFRNDVGKKLRLTEARFAMDGAKLPVVLTSAEPGKSYVILTGAVKPGPHVVTARLTYRGERGVFTYMKGYKLNVRSSQVVTTPAERTVYVTVVGAENQGMNVPLERRVVVRVEEGGR
jgi:hypothetical protein